MSYILQALKKAEEQRGASPRAVPTPRPLPPMTRPRWPWLAGGVIALAGVAGAFTFWMLGLLPAGTSSGPVRTAAVPDAAMVTPVAAPVATRPEPAPVTSVEPTTQPVRAEQPATTRLEPAPRPERATAARRGPVSREPAPDRMVAAVTAPPAPPRPVEAAAPPARSRGTTTLTPSPAAPPERVTTPRASPSPPVVAAAPSPAVAPPPAAAPAGDLKAVAAKLSLQVLSWAPEPKDRFVFVNGRKYFEGQAIEDRFLIERIAEDSVVLSHQGERVTLKGP